MTTQWMHDPAHPDASDLDVHDPTPGATCFGCWCYACGASTAGPRIEHNPGVERHHGDPSHRWCFEA